MNEEQPIEDGIRCYWMDGRGSGNREARNAEPIPSGIEKDNGLEEEEWGKLAELLECCSVGRAKGMTDGLLHA